MSDEGEPPPFVCPLGHEHHNTEEDEGAYCPEGACASDKNDTEWVKCGYIYYTGRNAEEDEFSYALWTDHEHDAVGSNANEAGTWRVCEECHYNLILAGLDGHANTPHAQSTV